jgi:transcriptional regulator with XRE-family HTH domain
MNIGRAIKLCRNQRGINQSELAEDSHLSTSYISLLERGEREDPSLSILESIASALEIPISVLLFLAADEDELNGLDKEIIEKLSTAAIQLMRKKA